MSNTPPDNGDSTQILDNINLDTHSSDNENNSTNTDTPEYEDKALNDTWILWYHDPLDTNWDLSSYKNLHEISSPRRYRRQTGSALIQVVGRYSTRRCKILKTRS